jgi:hypothetical protein
LETREWLASLGVVECARSLVGLLLIYSGVAKLFEMGTFINVVRAFSLLPHAIASSVARAVPVAECATGSLLLVAVAFPQSVARWSAVVAMLLLVVFSGALSINLMRGRRNISCGCFGARVGDQISWILVARNCILGGVAYLAFQQPSVNRAVILGERVGALLLGLSMLLAWQLATAILQLGEYKFDQQQ